MMMAVSRRRRTHPYPKSLGAAVTVTIMDNRDALVFGFEGQRCMAGKRASSGSALNRRLPHVHRRGPQWLVYVGTCRRIARGEHRVPRFSREGPVVALPSCCAIARFVAHRSRCEVPVRRRDPRSADLALVLIGEGKAACAPPTRRCPRRSLVVAGQTAVGVMTPRRSDGARRPASDAGRCPPSAAPRVRSVNGRRDIGRPQ